MARAIQPFHALVDGDVLYAVSTNEIDDPALESIGLGIVASELAWDAVLAAVPRLNEGSAPGEHAGCGSGSA